MCKRRRGKPRESQEEEFQNWRRAGKGIPGQKGRGEGPQARGIEEESGSGQLYCYSCIVSYIVAKYPWLLSPCNLLKRKTPAA